MDEFSYLSVLISFILGLAVTQILKGFRGILSHGHGFGFTGRSLRGLPSCCWCVRRTGGRCLGCETATIGRSSNFTMVLLNTILIYMITALVFPDFFGEGVVDLKENFYAHRGWFFTLAFSTIVVSVCKDVILDGRLPNTTNLIFHAVFGVTLSIGALTRSERYHKGLVVFGSALFVVYIVVLFGRIH